MSVHLRDGPALFTSRPTKTLPAEHLTDVELLTALFRSTLSPSDPDALAHRLLGGQGLSRFSRRDFTALSVASELGDETARALTLIQELTRRIDRPALQGRDLLSSPEQVSRYLRKQTSHFAEERVGVLLCDSRHRFLVDREVVKGSLDSACVSPRDILRRALLDGAGSIILYHNHPSGDPAPSRDDLALTRALAEAARIVGLCLLDHVVVGAEGTISLASRGLLPP